MKTCSNISFPSKVRFRKKVHSQASDHVWFFLTCSQSVRAKKRNKGKRKRKRRKREKKNCFSHKSREVQNLPTVTEVEKPTDS